MVDFPEIHFDSAWIIQNRGAKNPVDPFKPYAYIKEKEKSFYGEIEDVGTIFLTNKECPFKCLMCDLWKNTTNEKVSEGVIVDQIEWALARMGEIQHVKLYNSGSFFDVQAIPEHDYREIIKLVSNFKSVIIENHPNLIDRRCLNFSDSINGDLEVAIGLETVHPEVLKRLNKRMTLSDFEDAVGFLKKNDIRSRAFILLRPPFLSEEEGVLWAKKSINFAFQVGVECCILIPTRPGNGALDLLHNQGYYTPPKISSLENVLSYGIALNQGRVFADLWDLEFFSTCDNCFLKRKERLSQMNLQQKIQSDVICNCSD